MPESCRPIRVIFQTVSFRSHRLISSGFKLFERKDGLTPGPAPLRPPPLNQVKNIEGRKRRRDGCIALIVSVILSTTQCHFYIRIHYNHTPHWHRHTHTFTLIHIYIHTHPYIHANTFHIISTVYTPVLKVTTTHHADISSF